MRRLSILNFEAVTEICLDIDKSLNILIGAQASGKSTIAKVLYFCRKVRDFIVDYLADPDSFLKSHQNEDYVNLMKYIRSCFISCFGTTWHMEPFFIEYFYHEVTEKLRITLEDGYAKMFFSPEIRRYIMKCLQDAREIHEEQNRHTNSFLEKVRFQEELKEHYRGIAAEIFHDEEEIIYIPAGRSLLSVMSEQLNVIDNRSLDLPMRNFIELIENTKKKFGTRMDLMVKDYVKTVQGQIKNADVNLAYALTKKILKADYVSDADGEKLFYQENKWVKIAYSSSGQQESLWILLPIFVRILENRKCFVVIEEPEAHLFPDAQRTIVEMISLFIYSTGSEVLVTTHSPYILTSLNLLIHSHMVEAARKGAVEEVVVQKPLRIPGGKVDAYFVGCAGENYAEAIKSAASGLIDAAKIDMISESINRDTERLLNMEFAYDM